LSADAFVILKEKINVRIRIEAFLSSIFGRRIRLAEEGGYLKPKMQRVLGGAEYAMKEDECHGLKELITLLAFLYDDEFTALVIDEPELHLHPQFQTFLLAEIRKLAGDGRVAPLKKVFFLITHSPYLLDFRTLDDLRQCVIFHQDSVPTFVGILSDQDEYFLKRLLPRLNTHHKQFFFAGRPIFVEGYTDQQLFSLIQEGRSRLLGATGACFIDVNGKGEQDFFFKSMRSLFLILMFLPEAASETPFPPMHDARSLSLNKGLGPTSWMEFEN
jgi:AAA domain, putative AbiEii toxin, Type IV TA system